MTTDPEPTPQPEPVDPTPAPTPPPTAPPSGVPLDEWQEFRREWKEWRDGELAKRPIAPAPTPKADPEPTPTPTPAPKDDDQADVPPFFRRKKKRAKPSA